MVFVEIISWDVASCTPGNVPEMSLLRLPALGSTISVLEPHHVQLIQPYFLASTVLIILEPYFQSSTCKVAEILSIWFGFSFYKTYTNLVTIKSDKYSFQMVK